MLFVRCRGGISHNPGGVRERADMGSAVAALIRFIERFDRTRTTHDRFHRRAIFRAQVEFLKALVRVPSDNPPGDCARHGEASAALLERLGFTVERHPVPDDAGQAARHGVGDQPDRARALRQRARGR